MEPVVERRISERAFLLRHAATLLLGIPLAAACFLLDFGIFAPLSLLPWGLSLAHSRLARIGTQYRLFTDRLEIESGILSRTIDNLELFRVRDVRLHQGVYGRAVDLGDVYVHSTDTSTPQIRVRAIDDPRGFYQDVRRLVSQSRALNRTLILEEGEPIGER